MNEALKTAAAVLIFVMALTVSFNMFSKAKATADSKVKVVWVAKGESIPTTAEANSLCFRIL